MAPPDSPEPSLQRRTAAAPDGRSRTFYLLTADGGAAGEQWGAAGAAGVGRPLVVALHGGGESALRFHAASGLSELSVDEGFVLAYPEGVGESGRGQRDGSATDGGETDGGETDGGDGSAATSELPDPDRVRRRSWNAGRCCGAAKRDDVDDLGFMETLVAMVETEAAIDPQRRFVIGHSNGGMLAFRLALERPGLFAGIGVQSASIAVDAPGPTIPTHLIAVHGVSDRHHPIDGGRGPESSVESPYGSVREACERFRGVPGARVELVEVPEGTHSWMGPRSAAVAGEAISAGRHIAGGLPFAGFDTSAAIWDFLSRTPAGPRPEH